MEYVVNRYFNNLVPGQILKEEEVKEGWVTSGLVQIVEPMESFVEKVDEFVESLDPENTVIKKGKKK